MIYPYILYYYSTQRNRKRNIVVTDKRVNIVNVFVAEIKANKFLKRQSGYLNKLTYTFRYVHMILIIPKNPYYPLHVLLCSTITRASLYWLLIIRCALLRKYRRDGIEIISVVQQQQKISSITILIWVIWTSKYFRL